MIARKELGLDHLSDLGTQNLREFNSVSWAIIESLDIDLYFDVNPNDRGWADQIQSLERTELISSIDGRNIHFI